MGNDTEGTTRTIQSCNLEDAELVKTGYGKTRFLIDDSISGNKVMIRYWGPESKVSVHSHPYDEIWYVLEGKVEFVGKTYGVGSAILIPAGVEYGSDGAPKGATL